jgi:uncharacterized protein (DUF2235 family)
MASAAGPRLQPAAPGTGTAGRLAASILANRVSCAVDNYRAAFRVLAKREGAAVAKNIVLLSDGTGNSSAKIFKTNVWRLFQALDLSDPAKQVAYYDNGVGTSSFKLFAALGGIFGFGLKRNVIDIYSFCCRNYTRRPAGEEQDRIYGFGFSRGAFTMRIVAGFIARIGLVPYHGSDADLARDAKTAYLKYRRERNFHSGIFVRPLRAIRDFIRHGILRKPTLDDIGSIVVDKFHFLGVWDTVGAYGGPIEEITRAIDYYYFPLSMPDQFMNHKITRACHALALEEERDAFTPVLWDDRYVREGKKLHPVMYNWKPEPADPTVPLAPIDKERISQVWLVGVHSDIGGGYPQDGLSYFSLQWMMERAEVYGLTYRAVQGDWSKSLADSYDKLNDSRHGFAGYYRYRPRNLADLYRVPPYRLSLAQDIRHVLRLFANKPNPEDEVRAELGRAPDPRPAPKIHQAVLDRIANGNDGYAPIVLPKVYDVVTHAGAIVPNTTIPVDAHAATRALRQGKVWDWVWARRIVYFLTVLSALYLAALPLIEKLRPGRGAGTPFEIVTPLIDLIGAFLPSFAKPWLDAFRNSPGRFVVGLVIALALMGIGGWMQTRIRDLMRVIWKEPVGKAEPDRSFVHRLRGAGPYKAFWYVVKHWLLPAIFAAVIFLVLVLCVFYVASRISFTLFDATGHVCTPSGTATPVTGKSESKSFETKTLCTPTGLSVTRGQTYEVVLTVTEPWEDGYKFKKSDPAKAKGIETGPEGFGYDKMTPPMYLGLPIRRQIASNWFATILRVGDKGFGEVTPSFEREEPSRCQCPAGPTRYKARFKAPRSGEVFVYVNDSVVGIPAHFDLFYRADEWTRRTNKGKADLTIELVPNNSGK